MSYFKVMFSSASSLAWVIITMFALRLHKIYHKKAAITMTIWQSIASGDIEGLIDV